MSEAQWGVDVVLYSLVTVTVAFAVWKRRTGWARILAVVAILAIGLVPYFGVQASSRIAVEKQGPGIRDATRSAWEDGAAATRFVAQRYLPVGAFCALGLAALGVLPVIKRES